MKLSSRPGAAVAGKLVPVLVIVLLILVVFVDARRRAAEKKLEQLTVQLSQSGNTEENKAKAAAVVNEVRKLIDIPEGVEPTVATIVDVEALQEKNPFYAKAENGDYLIVTPTRAILYSQKKKMILDVVPVQLDQQAAQQNASKPATLKQPSSAASSR